MAGFGVYGVTLITDTELAVSLPESGDPPDVAFELVHTSPALEPLGDVEPVYVEGRRGDGRPDFAFWDLDDRAVIRITGAMDFHLWSDRIVCHLTAPEFRYLVEVALFGMVFALWLERRGTLTLHGAAVVVDGRGVAFLASGGGGKTSTSAAFTRSGHPILSDDLLALEERDDAVFVRPGLPQVRMWPEQARHFVGTDTGFPMVDPNRSKLRIPVGDGFGSFASGPAPLTHVYVLERGAEADAPTTHRLRPSQAALALIHHSFLSREVVRYGLQGPRLELLARIVGSVPISRVVVPTGLDRLGDLVAAIEDEAAGTPG